MNPTLWSHSGCWCLHFATNPHCQLWPGKGPGIHHSINDISTQGELFNAGQKHPCMNIHKEKPLLSVGALLADQIALESSWCHDATPPVSIHLSSSQPDSILISAIPSPVPSPPLHAPDFSALTQNKPCERLLGFLALSGRLKRTLCLGCWCQSPPQLHLSALWAAKIALWLEVSPS